MYIRQKKVNLGVSEESFLFYSHACWYSEKFYPRDRSTCIGICSTLYKSANRQQLLFPMRRDA